jgi:hypothetical protein
LEGLQKGFITAYEYQEGMELIDKAIPMANGYINYLGKKKGTAVTNNKQRITNNRDLSIAFF